MKISSKAIELLNTHDLTAELMARGWNVYLPVYDDGIDMLATRQDAREVVRIQLKSRWTIDGKYKDRDIEIAFKHKGDWYVAPHETMVAIGERHGYCSSKSWLANGGYSRAGLSRKLAADMAAHTIDTRFGPRQVMAD